MPGTFASTSKQYLSLVNNTTGAGTGQVVVATTGPTFSFVSGGVLTVAARVKLTDTNHDYCIVAKDQDSYANGSYILRYNADTDSFDWIVSTHAGSFTASIPQASNITSASSGNLIVCQWQSGGASIDIDNGAFSGVSTVTQVKPEEKQFTGTAHDAISSEKFMLTIGYDPNNPNATYLNGKVGSVGIWNRLLTAAEITSLHNSGAGKTYGDLSGGILANLAGWWDLVTDAKDGTLFGNDLTNNGTVTFAAAW